MKAKQTVLDLFHDRITISYLHAYQALYGISPSKHTGRNGVGNPLTDSQRSSVSCLMRSMLQEGLIEEFDPEPQCRNRSFVLTRPGAKAAGVSWPTYARQVKRLREQFATDREEMQFAASRRRVFTQLDVHANEVFLQAVEQVRGSLRDCGVMDPNGQGANGSQMMEKGVKRLLRAAMKLADERLSANEDASSTGRASDRDRFSSGQGVRQIDSAAAGRRRPLLDLDAPHDAAS